MVDYSTVRLYFLPLLEVPLSVEWLYISVQLNSGMAIWLTLADKIWVKTAWVTYRQIFEEPGYALSYILPLLCAVNCNAPDRGWSISLGPKNENNMEQTQLSHNGHIAWMKNNPLWLTTKIVELSVTAINLLYSDWCKKG